MCVGPDFRELTVYKVKCDLCGAAVPRQVEKDPEIRESKRGKSQMKLCCESQASVRVRASPLHKIEGKCFGGIVF